MKKNTIVIRFDSIRFDFLCIFNTKRGVSGGGLAAAVACKCRQPPVRLPPWGHHGGAAAGGCCWRLLAVMAAWGLMAAFGGSADGWGSAGPTGPWSRRAGTGAAMPERAQGLRHGGFGGH